MSGAQRGTDADVMLMVARDGIAQHYTPLTIAITGITLDPKLDNSTSDARIEKIAVTRI